MNADSEHRSGEILDGHDSITSLPLSAFNLENSTLRSATLRKNIALDTVIDFSNSIAARHWVDNSKRINVTF